MRAWQMRCLMSNPGWRISSSKNLWLCGGRVRQKLEFAGFRTLSHAGFMVIATMGVAITESCMLDWGILPTWRRWASLHIWVLQLLLLTWMLRETYMYQLVLHEIEQDAWTTVDPGPGVRYVPTDWQLKLNKVDVCDIQNLWWAGNEKKSGKKKLCQTLC